MLRRGWEFLEGRLLPFLALAGSAGAILLAFARQAQFAALLIASLLLAAGVIQSRLGLQRSRSRRSHLREMRQEIQYERGFGHLCAGLAIVLVLMAWFLPSAVAIACGIAISLLVFLRGLAIASDNAIKEGELLTVGSSAADECSCIERWARRAATWRNRIARKFAAVATDTVPAGEIGRIQSLVLSLTVTSMLAFILVGAALAAERFVGDPGSEPVPEAEAEPKPEPKPEGETPGESGPDDPPTYAESCPAMPDPLEIGHGLGVLFRYDGAFKAGCGTEARQVLETGAWVAAGICAGQQRSVAVAGNDGDKALLYGSAAKFAWRAALQGELISAEAAYPAEADVFTVETLAGARGFARKAAGGGTDRTVDDCTDVTGTARPFAELPPPMMLLWRDLVQYRAAWSWPLREDGAGDGLAFVSHPGGALVARGACTGELSCYLDVDGVRWPGNEPAYVSLDELAPYMPPSSR